jgi:hypothetical protein
LTGAVSSDGAIIGEHRIRSPFQEVVEALEAWHAAIFMGVMV